MKTNFDVYLEEQLKDPAFAGRFARSGEAWDVALQIAALREKAGLSQKDLARKLKTSQQQISRLESPARSRWRAFRRIVSFRRTRTATARFPNRKPASITISPR